MVILIVGLIIFLGVHSVPMFQLRQKLVDTLGMGAFKGLFALTAAIGLTLTIYGYGLARQDPIVIYSLVPGLKHVMQLLMLFVFIFLIAAYVPGKIKQTLKHPMLIATKTWALAHLLVNGNLEDLFLFGGFLIWAVFSLISIKKRERLNPPTKEVTYSIVYDVIAVVVGLSIYVLFVLWIHEWITGVPIISG